MGPSIQSLFAVLGSKVSTFCHKNVPRAVVYSLNPALQPLGFIKRITCQNREQGWQRKAALHSLSQGRCPQQPLQCGCGGGAGCWSSWGPALDLQAGVGLAV